MDPETNNAPQVNQEVPAQPISPKKSSMILEIFLTTLFWFTLSIIANLVIYNTPLIVAGNTVIENFGKLILINQIFIPLIIVALVLNLMQFFLRPVAKIIIILYPILAVILYIQSFFSIGKPCFGVGCLVLMLEHGLPTLLSISVLPLAWVRIKNKDFYFRSIFSKSLIPGLIILVITFILGSVSFFPLGNKLRLESQEYKRVQSVNATILSDFKAKYNPLSPTYLPRNVLPKTLEEHFKNSSLEKFYFCGPTTPEDGAFEILQIPVEKKIIYKNGLFKDPFQFTGGQWDNWVKVVDKVEVLGNPALIIEMYNGPPESWLGTSDFYEASKASVLKHNQEFRLTARQLIWETHSLQIIVGNQPQVESACILSEEELIKIAESMKTL
ncbi:MAG: hypothetical protein AAB521_00545 [Patescibacteria group bacterium]